MIDKKALQKTMLKELVVARKRERELLKHSQSQIASHENEMCRILGDMHKIARHNIMLGSWDCKKSPIGVCYYDMSSHMRDDECLVCGHPDERK